MNRKEGFRVREKRRMNMTVQVREKRRMDRTGSELSKEKDDYEGRDGFPIPS